MSDNWYIYILECADMTLYTGIALDVERRLVEHNTINTKAAKYVRARRPARLVYQETCASRSEAQKREHEIKNMPRQVKLALIYGDSSQKPVN